MKIQRPSKLDMYRAIIVILLIFLTAALSQNFLNWTVLDKLNRDTAQLKEIWYGILNKTTDDPRPNSTHTLQNLAVDIFLEEDALWTGNINAGDAVSIWDYIISMKNMTDSMERFIRNTYREIFRELPLNYCNALTRPAELILSTNLGYSPNEVTYNETELNLLIPPNRCVPPGSIDPTFQSVRRFSAQYKLFLFMLNDYLECILNTHAFPSYAKGTTCLESYYLGEQDGGDNPEFFGIFASKQDLTNTLHTFQASLTPADVDSYVPTTYSDFQFYLFVARQYQEIARKVRYLVIQLYDAMTSNYIRLLRVKECRALENINYQQALAVPPTWCNYSLCFQESHNFTLLCDTLNSGPLEPATLQLCNNNTCLTNDSFPDPLYCDQNRTCPVGFSCSLAVRRCFNTILEAPGLQKSYNTTICGYPRRLADATRIRGQVQASDVSVIGSSFTKKTYWPQDCSSGTCVDLRIYGNPTNITFNFTDPNAGSFPPEPNPLPPAYSDLGYFKIQATEYVSMNPGSATVTGTIPGSMTAPEYGEFYGYWLLTDPVNNVYKLLGTFIFVLNSGNTTVQGVDFNITLASSTVENCQLPGLVVNTFTGAVEYNPVLDVHPNPRFNDPNECYFLEVTATGLVPLDPFNMGAINTYHDEWVRDLTPQPTPINQAPMLYPCNVIFLRKILYYSTDQWLEDPDYEEGVQNNKLRYVCQRSQVMPAVCSRLGVAFDSDDYFIDITNVNPPASFVQFLL